jgi:4,4'-diaponeurosporenoate glycosyltransferase
MSELLAGLVASGLVSIGFVSGWIAFFYRRRVPAAQNLTQKLPPVSLIIPARNEAANLPKLLESLRAQDGIEMEWIVVDDHSVDATSEIAGRAGARVVAARDLPEGWTGKNSACFQGAEAAVHEWLCFVDADAEFQAGGLKRLLSYGVRGPAGSAAVSVLPYHQMQSPYEQFSAFFNLLMAMGTEAFSLGGEHKQKLVGQCLLLRREDYKRVEGHQSVKGEILENFFLSRKLRELGVDCQTFAGQGVLHFRMYPEGFSQLVEGWSKAFVRGLGQTSPQMMALTIVWITGAMTAMLALVLVPGLLSVTLYLLVAVQFGIFLRRVGSYSWLTAFLFPLPLCFYQVLFFSSLLSARRRKGVTWRGRTLP